MSEILDIAQLGGLTQVHRKIEIKHPKTKAPIGVSITLCSIDDDRLKVLKRKILDRRLHLEARGKTFKAEEIEQNQNEITFNSIVEWDWYGLTYEGKKPELNRKNALEIFEKYPIFAEQINEEIGDTASFFGD